MLPILFQIGPLKIHSFGFMMAMSFLVTTILAGREFRRRGLNPEFANEAGLAAMIGGVIGAKIYFLLDHLGDLKADPLAMIFSGSGLTWYGGLIGGAVGALLVAHWRGVGMLRLCDIAAPLLALGYAIGRGGCFLNGDDYGRPSDVPWAMAFPKGMPPTLVRVHPTQLYEIAAALLIFLFLTGVRSRLTRTGALFGLYLVLAGVERFLIEFLRTNAPGPLGMTVAQWFSLGLIAVGGWLYGSRAPRESARAGA